LICVLRSGAGCGLGGGQTQQRLATERRSQGRERSQEGRQGHAGPGHQRPKTSETETCAGKVGLQEP